MKRILLFVTNLLFCATLFAQTDDPGCNISVVVSDATCETGYTSPCSGTSGYTSSTSSSSTALASTTLRHGRLVAAGSAATALPV